MDEPNVDKMTDNENISIPSTSIEGTANRDQKYSTPSKNIVKTAKGILVPSRQRRREPIRKNALSYLTGKSERDFQIRERELGLEERKIALEERRMALEEAKFEMEKKRMELEFLRKAKAEMDRQQFEVLLKDKETNNTIINVQQKLIESLMYNKEK